MVRLFPATVRLRALTILVIVGTVTSLMMVPPASSDDLRDRRDTVRRELRESQRQFDQSSNALVRATHALKAARQRLTVARQRLSKARGDLAAAVALDRQMQARLDLAVERLQDAREALTAGERDLAAQEERLGQVAVQTFQRGDPGLMGLSMVLTSRDPADLTSQLNSVQNVLDKESVMLARLEASQVLLEVKKEAVRDAKVVVAEQRQQAEDNVRLKASLEREAEDAAAQVADLVTAHEKAAGEARRARAKDLERLRDLQRERDRITALLERRAEAARRRASRLAAARTRQATADDLLSYPVDSYITSPYGMRLHPVYRRWALHDGTDFGASCGTPIRAAASGTVIARYYNSAYGNRVIIDHGYQRGAGLATAYNHMSSYSTYVGQRVQRGDIIGFAGTTGYSTGCHLHLMVFRDGATVDPVEWL